MEEFLPYHLSNATVNFSVLNFSESTSVKSHEENKSVSNHYIDTILYVTSSGSKVTFGYFVVCILSIILAGWMIFLNGLVIHALLNKKRHSEVTDYFVSSLSIADLVTGILLLYVTSYSLIQYQNQWECLFRFGLTYAVSQSSFTHILAITIDRYVKIIFPFRYFTLITKKTVIITSSTIWFFSIIIGLLPLLGWHKEYTSNKNGGTVCRFFGVLPDGYFILNFITSLITSLGMLSLYIHIIYIAIQQCKQMQTLTEGYDFTRNGHDDQAWRLVKTVAIIVLISNLCWLPGGKQLLVLSLC